MYSLKRTVSLLLAAMLIFSAVSAAASSNDEIYEKAIAYYEGNGVEKNDELAFLMLAPLAKEGHAPSQSALGYFFLNGIGTKEDAEVAFELFKLAAEQDDAYGMY